jgi:hypothetical protein
MIGKGNATYTDRILVVEKGVEIESVEGELFMEERYVYKESEAWRNNWSDHSGSVPR